MMRVATTVAFGLILGASSGLAQDTVSVGVGGELSAPVGDQLRVPLFADLSRAGATKLGSYTIRVKWNPAVLAYRSVLPGVFAVPLIRADSVTLGVLRATAVSPAGNAGAFSLFDLDMQPIAQVADTVRVQVSELSAAGTFADLLATAVVQTPSAAFCAAMGRWGDLDGDLAANSRDALAILSNLVGLPAGTGFNVALGDVDGDGLVNSRDALILLSYAVGLDVPGQRVLLVAAGACGGSVPQFVILPDTADLVLNQAVPLRVFARDAAGRLTSLDNLGWQVRDGQIATVDSGGVVVARSVGTTTVTAGIGPGAAISATVIARARRGTWYVDAQRAIRATVQMGTQQWPFATPEYTFPVAAEGDTVRVAPGVVDFAGLTCFSGQCYNDDGRLHVGVVVIGDTLPNGARPLFRGQGAGDAIAFPWAGGAHGELRNIVFRGFQNAASLAGLKSVVLDNVRVEMLPNSYGYGVYGERFADSVALRRSVILGDSATQGGVGVNLYNGTRYVEVHDTEMRHLATGLQVNNVDSLDVLRSQFTNMGSGGINAYNYGGSGIGARISQSRFDGTGDAIYLYGARGVALDHNYIAARNYGDPIYASTSLSGDAPPYQGSPAIAPAPSQVSGTKFTMRGDSMLFRSAGYEWAYAEGWDSVMVDSLWMESPADTAIYQYGYFEANYARFTNSQFLNLYQQAIEFRGHQLVVDNSDFTGCAVCAAGAYALQASTNDSGPSVTVTNSRFTKVYAALRSVSSGTRAGPMVITGNQVDSTFGAFYVYTDSLLFTDNVLTRVISRGLQRYPSYSNRPFQTAAVLRNQISCSPATGAYGIELYYSPARVDSNSTTNCGYGVYAAGSPSYPVAVFGARGNVIQDASTAASRTGIRLDSWIRPVIQANRVTGGYYGIYLTTTDSVTVLLDSNAVSGTGYAGMLLSSVAAPITGMRNNISSNLAYGIYNSGGNAVRSLTQGQLVGNALYAIYNLTGTFGAQSNWWGNLAGPGGGVADSVFGSVNASPPLPSPPTDVPPLSAPSFPAPVAGGSARAGWVGVGVVEPGSPAHAEEPRLRHRRHVAEQAAREAARRARAGAVSPRDVSRDRPPQRER